MSQIPTTPERVNSQEYKVLFVFDKRERSVWFLVQLLFLLSVMAAADLRDELSCSICLSIYTDPVSLPCGHNFCQGCIGTTWDTQEGSGAYSCPECRAENQERPALYRNRALGNIAERFCPTETQPGRLCSLHNELLNYYCCAVPICGACGLRGEHRGHSVELLSEAFENEIDRLRNILENLRPEREETERGTQRLLECRREVADKAANEARRVTALLRNIREQLEALERRLLSDISRQRDNLSLPFTNLIQELEINEAELSRKIRHIEELCNMADPLTVLQERELHGSADNEGGRERDSITYPVVRDLDVDLISETLLTGLTAIVTGVKGRVIPRQEATDLLLDINTAHNHVFVSGDRKCATYSLTDQRHLQTPEGFQEYPQVLSTRSFPPGRHYWEVEASELGGWRVGVAYPSIERRGGQSCIGYNNKSWCLCRWDNNKYSVTHGSIDTQLHHIPSCRRIRISLDYEAGRLSFYELSEPIRHLHTFTATFTEPLYIGFGIGMDNTWVRIIS